MTLAAGLARSALGLLGGGGRVVLRGRGRGLAMGGGRSGVGRAAQHPLQPTKLRPGARGPKSREDGVEEFRSLPKLPGG